MKSRLISTILVMLLNVNLCMAAGVPYTLNYQGMLTSKTGQLINTPQEITFNLYTTPIGAELPFWTETLANVPVSNGQLSVTLGTVTQLDPAKFSGDTYLGMKVGTQAEMLPRQKMTSVPYAFNAVSALNGIPTGGVIMWTGTVVPAGWALCDGSNGTPDLRDRFIVGVGNRFGSGKVRTVTGGEEDHVLTANEMPSHTHTQNAHNHTLNAADIGNSSLLAPGALGSYSGYKQSGVNANKITDSSISTNQYTGGGASHNNLPPYYALAFIMKL